MDRYDIQAASLVFGLVAAAGLLVIAMHWHGHSLKFDRDHDPVASIDTE